MTWYSKNAVSIFDKLTSDEEISKCIEDYIISVTYKNRFDSKNVPQLVLIVMSLLMNDDTILNDDGELQEVIDLFKGYFITKINKNILNFDMDEFKKNYEICGRLAILKKKYSKKTGLCCIK